MSFVGHRGRNLLRAATAAACGLLTLVPLASAAAATPQPTVAQQLASLHEVTYWPADEPGAAMWMNWQPKQIQADFAKASSLSVNTVRIIIYMSAFGWPNPSATMVRHLHDIFTMAAADHLKVQLTLFDHWSDYTDQADTNAWINNVLVPYANDSQLAFVELQNEVNVMNPVQMSWVANTLPVLKSAVGSVPVTVSISGDQGAPTLTQLQSALGSVRPDFWDVHYYDGAQFAYASLSNDLSQTGGLPLYIGETGQSSSDPTIAGSSPQSEAQYIGLVAEACKRLGIPDPSIWDLYDFPSAFNTTNPSQDYFGLLTTSGAAKPAAAVVQQLFSTGTLPNSLNGTFTSNIGGWAAWYTPVSTLTWDPNTGYKDPGALELQKTVAIPGGSPSAYTTPVLQPTAAGQVFRFSAAAKGNGVTSPVYLVIAGYASNGHWLGNATSNVLPNGTSNWTNLSVQATIPAGVGYVQLYLVSTTNAGPVWFDDVSFSQVG